MASTCRLRTFVAVAPPPGVRDALSDLDRLEVDGLRRIDPDQWHVTLRFLGDLEPEEVERLRSAVRAVVAGFGPLGVIAGPATATFGRSVLHVPIGGLDGLAEAVERATGDLGLPPEPRPFTGHLTLIRAGRGHRVPTSMIGRPVEGHGVVDAVLVMASETRHDGARHRVLDRIPLRG